MSTRSFISIGVLIGSVASTHVATASCNSLPAASEVRNITTIVQAELAQANGTSLPLNQTQFPAAFRYKVALGRVDGLFFTPGPEEMLRFAADDLCVGDELKDAAPVITSVERLDDLAIFVAFDAAADAPLPMWPYLHDSTPPISIRELEAAYDRLPVAHDLGEPRRSLYFIGGGRWDENVNAVPLGHGVQAFQVPVPSLVGELSHADAQRSAWKLESSSVRVLATHIEGKTPQALAAELSEFIRNDCSAICAALRGEGAELCADSIYTRSPSNAIHSQFAYAKDEMLCSLDIVQTYSDNPFSEVCEPGDPDPDKIKSAVAFAAPGSVSAKATLSTGILDSGLEPCDPTTSVLAFWRSRCGGVHFPLDYTNVRLRRNLGTIDSGAPGDDARVHFIESITPIKRYLYGQSGVGRDGDAATKRIYLPGREFAGSTPELDRSTGNVPPDVNWRRPELDVWYPDGPESSEIGLYGVADKNKSVIHVFPRMPATYVCPATTTRLVRGCMAADNTGAVCACTDIETAPCTCEQLYVSPRFFACSGGDRENMPCTRDKHCKSRDPEHDDGTCSRQPICRPKFTVWHRMSDGDPDPSNAVPCDTDAACGETEQCGYSLFDFTGRLGGVGWSYLDRDVVAGGARTRRGACAHDRSLACSNSTVIGTPPLCPEDKRCRGYRLIAGGEKP